jgi:hypothetical protein
MAFQASRLIVILRQEFVTYPGLLAKNSGIPSAGNRLLQPPINGMVIAINL